MKRRLLIILVSTVWWNAPAGGHFPPAVSPADTVMPVSWSLMMEAGIAGARDSLAVFGVRTDAAPDYDPQYDVPRPPAPPGASIQVYFPHDGGNWPAMLGNKFASDITSPQSPGWRMVVETNAGPGMVTLEWDTAVISPLPSSYYLLMTDSAADSLITIRQAGSYAFMYTGPRVFLIRAEFASTIIGITAGWNILSVPRTVADSSAAALFPGGVSPAYEFDSAYHARDSMSAGRGYWLKFASPAMTSVTGLSIDRIDIPVRTGWNMIGALSETIAPPESPEIVSLFYEYSGGYVRADSLVPGRGYWVKVSEDGTLGLGPAVAAARARGASAEDDRFPHIRITSPGGGAAVLRLLTAAMSEVPREYELPPLPPAPGFDARFRNGCGAELLPAEDGSSRDYTIEVQSGGQVVSVAGDAGSPGVMLYTETGPDRWRAITGLSEPVALTRGSGRRVFRIRAVTAGGIPSGFRVEGSYPNPFNPSTRIQYYLPADADMTLRVMDTRGETVYRGSSVRRSAGRHEYLFDAGALGLASGVYFFSVAGETAGSGMRFSGSGKMVFIK